MKRRNEINNFVKNLLRHLASIGNFLFSDRHRKSLFYFRKIYKTTLSIRNQIRTHSYLWRRRRTHPHCSSSRVKADQSIRTDVRLLEHVPFRGDPSEFLWRDTWRSMSLWPVSTATARCSLNIQGLNWSKSAAWFRDVNSWLLSSGWVSLALSREAGSVETEKQYSVWVNRESFPSMKPKTSLTNKRKTCFCRNQGCLWSSNVKNILSKLNWNCSYNSVIVLQN